MRMELLLDADAEITAIDTAFQWTSVFHIWKAQDGIFMPHEIDEVFSNLLVTMVNVK